jgi:mono/diheme cytochrome c family protein
MSTSRSLGVAATLAALLGGCAAARRAEPAAAEGVAFFGARRAPASRPGPSLSLEAGARLYATLCSACHGEQGRGDTPLAADLSPVPADFTRCNFKYRSTPSGSLPLRRDLLRTVAVGLPGAAMPSFGPLLPEAGLHAVAAQVEARCSRFAEESPEPPLPLPWPPPPYSTESARRGKAVYAREHCASCHGEGGRGDGLAAAALRDLRGRPVRPRDHTRGVYRGGFGRLDIYRAFSTGLAGTPMPAVPPTVSQADRWDLTHFLVSLSASRNRAARLLESTPSWYDPARAWGLPWR